MSSLQSAAQLFLASSVKGGFPSSLNRDPEHVHANVQEHLKKCELVHGGKHGTGANCGEVHAASKFFKDNPDRKHIEGGKFVAFGHPFGNKLRKGEVVPPCTGSGKHNWGCEQFVKSVTRPLDRPLTPIPGREGVDAKGKAPAGGKPSPLRTGVVQVGLSSSIGGKPLFGGGTIGRKPGTNQNAQQPLSPLSNNSPPPQAKPKQGKGQPGQPAPQGPPPGRPVAPPKQRPEPEPQQPQRPGPLAPLSPSASIFKNPSPPKERPASPGRPTSPQPASGSGKSSPSAPSSPRPPKDHPLPPPPPPSQRPVSALTQKQQSSRPPRPSQKQPQQKAKAPASVPKPPSGPRPPTPPPPAARPPSPPPIPRPGSPSPPPSARPASPPWQVAGKKGGKGRKGKRDVKLTRALLRRALLRQALVRRAAIVGQGWKGVALW